MCHFQCVCWLCLQLRNYTYMYSIHKISDDAESGGVRSTRREKERDEKPHHSLTKSFSRTCNHHATNPDGLMTSGPWFRPPRAFLKPLCGVVYASQHDVSCLRSDQHQQQGAVERFQGNKIDVVVVRSNREVLGDEKVLQSCSILFLL